MFLQKRLELCLFNQTVLYPLPLYLHQQSLMYYATNYVLFCVLFYLCKWRPLLKGVELKSELTTGGLITGGGLNISVSSAIGCSGHLVDHENGIGHIFVNIEAI